jgi:hypothetical protein
VGPRYCKFLDQWFSLARAAKSLQFHILPIQSLMFSFYNRAYVVIRGSFEKIVNWRQCAAVRLLCLPLHNSGALPPVQELFKRHS